MKKIETERKFIIQIPDAVALAAQADYTESEITQIYLEDEECTHRIRKRCYGSVTEFTENTKRRISTLSCIENERTIDEAEFLLLSKKIQHGTAPLFKTRRTFSYDGKTVELDFYPQWQKSCVMEIELESERAELKLPDFIKIVREVTGERAYSNHSMAHKFPCELI